MTRGTGADHAMQTRAVADRRQRGRITADFLRK